MSRFFILEVERDTRSPFAITTEWWLFDGAENAPTMTPMSESIALAHVGNAELVECELDQETGDRITRWRI